MLRVMLILALVLGAAAPTAARVEPFPAGFRAQSVATNGTNLFVRVGGQGTAVILLHGFRDTGGMWAPLAGRACEGPHGYRARPTRHGPVGAS
jgi:hypothetical protein